jgi:hypothetical protein
MRKILPTLTTTKGSNWKTKIEEINKIRLKEIALFPTCLNRKERKELYRLLGKSSVKQIPFVHLRNDMELAELDYFVKNYKTRVFSIHMKIEYRLFHNLSKYKKIIYIENVYHSLNEKELKEFGGICLDISHLENDRLLNKKRFENNLKILEKFPVGCNHISAIKRNTRIDERGEIRYDAHYLENLSELDYLKNYPSEFFSHFWAIELENSIKEQLRE